jgi:acyl-CoA synthetase (AMP-forming)/AMP-acid ligase II
VSRKSEIIKNEAGLVSPIEVEGALYAHAAVLEAGVVGVPDIFGGEILQAYVVLHRDTTPVTESQLIDFLQTKRKIEYDKEFTSPSGGISVPRALFGADPLVESRHGQGRSESNLDHRGRNESVETRSIEDVCSRPARPTPCRAAHWIWENR